MTVPWFQVEVRDANVAADMSKNRGHNHGKIQWAGNTNWQPGGTRMCRRALDACRAFQTVKKIINYLTRTSVKKESDNNF